MHKVPLFRLQRHFLGKYPHPFPSSLSICSIHIESSNKTVLTYYITVLVFFYADKAHNIGTLRPGVSDSDKCMSSERCADHRVMLRNRMISGTVQALSNGRLIIGTRSL